MVSLKMEKKFLLFLKDFEFGKILKKCGQLQIFKMAAKSKMTLLPENARNENLKW
jgi:hypothetical protein